MLTVSLQCQFEKFQLDLDETFPSDKIIGLFGASGSGKSKLLRQLLGFDRGYQLTAKVEFNATCWQKSGEKKYLSTEQRGIGYLPQTIDLFPHLSVKENIFFSLINKKYTLEKSWIETVITQLAIEDIQTKFPEQLSGGQKQRVGLARSIVAAKNILILDEPLSSVGEDHKPKIMQLLKTLNHERKLPVIFSSHSRFEHAFLTDHLVTLQNGSVLQSGNYQQIATDINNDFAQVPDAINHLKAKVVSFDDKFSLNLLQINNHQLWAGHQEIKTGGSVTLEIRAKDISISTRVIEKTSILNSLKVKIAEIQEISGHQYLLKLAFEESFLVAFITKKSYFDLELRPKLDVQAMFKAVNVLPISDAR